MPMPPVPPAGAGESSTTQLLRMRLARLEREMSITSACAAISKSKYELASQLENYARNLMEKASARMNCKILRKLLLPLSSVYVLPESNPYAAVACTDEDAESVRVITRVNSLMKMASNHHVFWTNKANTEAVVKLEDRLEQIYTFFKVCRKSLAMVFRTLFPANEQPESLRRLLKIFRSPAHIQKLVRAQMIAGAEIALTFVHAKLPTLDLLDIVKMDGVDPVALQAEVAEAARIAVTRLEAGHQVITQLQEDSQ